ncbi:putative allergen [Aspergillus mulundensis]|uniref:Allergen Asp f 4 n=1 Tax=Aspergillus mulundensis TaxID=1810919 RepID=A0A3D8SCF3_9EURO|nr:hypothetical protein DSM5745_04346 [Aspergillus mulundensis]RDW84020.1 hypothetical protein DSM5745_04346 [Aspergillus mulundensis]
MQLTKYLMLLAAVASTTLARHEGHQRRHASIAKRITTTAAPADTGTSPASAGPASDLPSASSTSSQFSTSGFGRRTSSSGSGITYKGNVGNPYGSNMIEVSESDAQSYKYVVKLSGQNSEPWDVVFFNKYGPTGLMNGWFGFSALKLSLGAGETKYVAIDDDTNGGFAAAAGGSMPLDPGGGYATTWGEFDFGSTGNSGWSGFDVSAITPQSAGMDVQGMKICEEVSGTCSSITPGAAKVHNAYTKAETAVGGIGGNIQKDRRIVLDVTIDYQG